MGDFKPWIDTNRTMLKDVIPLDTPFNLGIEASSLCNAKCIYCVHSVKDDKQNFYKGNMKWDLFTKIIDEAKKFPVKIKKIDLYNIGEPLCNPNLADMVNYAKKEKVSERVEFITNGILLTPKNIDQIIAAGIDTIRISLQGVNAEKYKEICGVNLDFPKFIQNLSYLYNHKKQCCIKMKISDIALKDEHEGVEILKNIFGNISDSLFIENIIPLFSEVRYETIDKKIINHARYKDGLKQIREVCVRPFYSIIVCANGDITSCCDPSKRIVFGNLYNDSLYDIWNSDKRKNFLKMMLRKQRKQHAICSTCQFPNDVSIETDILDSYTDEILKRFDEDM